MITIEKCNAKDWNLLDKWKRSYESKHYINGNSIDRMYWKEKIDGFHNCKYWVINNGGIKIGIVNINHINSEGCILEYYIGDVHFRGRNITSSILWNMYDYIFNYLKLKYAVTIILEDDKKNLNTHLSMKCEIVGKFKENEHKNEKINDVIYVLMKSEKWNNIKDEFDFQEISIEKI